MTKKGFWDYFGGSLSEFGDKFVSFLKVYLAFYLLPIALLAVAGITFFVTFASYNGFEKSSEIESFFSNLSPEILVPLTLGFLLLVFIFLALNIFMTLAFLEISFSKKPLSFKEALKKSSPNFWKFFGLTIVLTISLVFLYILLIIPGIIFTIFWVFSMYIMVDKKVGVFESMKMSFRLVKGRWWSVFGYSLLILIIALATSFILGMIPFGGLISTLIVTPVVLIFFKNWYLDLKVGKRG